MSNQFLEEVDFSLPRGYRANSDQVFRNGRMRQATAADEIEALADPRVQQNEAFLPAVLLSRVVTNLGDLQRVSPETMAHLYAADFAYLEDLYLRLNSYESVVVAAACPECSAHFHLQVVPMGGRQP